MLQKWRRDELKEIDIKNCTCYFFDDIMRVLDIDFDILLDEKSYNTCKNILTYDIPYKSFMGVTPFRIWFEKIDEFIKIYDGIKHLWKEFMIRLIIL